jgi:sugar phosphate isomerase/epimerase
MIPGDTLHAKASALKGWGIDAIAIFWPFDRWDDATRQELLSLEEQLGVTPCEFALVGPLYGRLMDPDPAVRADCFAMYSESAEMCARLGMVTELEFQYCLQDPMPLFDPYEQLSPEQSDSFVETYRKICALVNGSHGKVLLEPLNRYESRYLNRVQDCAVAVDAVGQPSAGLLFDFFHASIEEADIVTAIKLAGSRIRHVHLGDNNRLLPGSGNIDWKGGLAALREIGYDGYLNFECATGGDPAETVPAAVRFLRSQLS